MPFPRLRELAVVAAIAAVLSLVTACPPVAGGTSVPSIVATPSPTPTSTVVPASDLRIVALGDSVTSGYNCHCTAFPAEYAALLAKRDSVRARAANLGVPGLTSGRLLAQLAGGSAVDTSTRAAVTSAGIVVVTIGANDFFDQHDDPITAGTCAGATHIDCTRDELTTMTRTLSAVIDQIRSLRDGAPTTIMLTGYWKVFEDGDVADKAFPDEGIAASVALTKAANAGIRADALAENAIYVDLWPVFEGANSDKDPTDLLASDGDHPNAAGHAGALLADTPRL